jgi:hypothetical protein
VQEPDLPLEILLASMKTHSSTAAFAVSLLGALCNANGLELGLSLLQFVAGEGSTAGQQYKQSTGKHMQYNRNREATALIKAAADPGVAAASDAGRIMLRALQAPGQPLQDPSLLLGALLLTLRHLHISSRGVLDKVLRVMGDQLVSPCPASLWQQEGAAPPALRRQLGSLCPSSNTPIHALPGRSADLPCPVAGRPGHAAAATRVQSPQDAPGQGCCELYHRRLCHGGPAAAAAGPQQAPLPRRQVRPGRAQLRQNPGMLSPQMQALMIPCLPLPPCSVGELRPDSLQLYDDGGEALLAAVASTSSQLPFSQPQDIQVVVKKSGSYDGVVELLARNRCAGCGTIPAAACVSGLVG